MADASDGVFEELRSAAARLEDPAAAGAPPPQEQPAEALPGVRATPTAARRLPAEAVAAAQRLVAAAASDGAKDLTPAPPRAPQAKKGAPPGHPTGADQGTRTQQQPAAPQRTPPAGEEPIDTVPRHESRAAGPPEMADVLAEETTIAAAAALSELELLVAGTVRSLPEGPVVVGRDPGPDGLAVTEPEVSRRHLELRPTALGLQATDLGSLNGTCLRRGGQEQDVTTTGTVLRPGDELITAGGTVLVSLRRHDP